MRDRARPVLLAGLLALSAPAATPSRTVASDPPDSVGGVSINAGAAWTAQPAVEVIIPVPAGGEGLVRLSNDGALWGDPVPWARALAWDLTNESAGGSAADGAKNVYVQWTSGDGWRDVGRDGVTLDTHAPTWANGPVQVWPPSSNSQTHADWRVGYGFAGASDNLSRELDWEFSIDGGETWWHNTNFYSRNETVRPGPPLGGIDMRTLGWGGDFSVGERTVCARMTDEAGNVGPPSCQTFDFAPAPGTSTHVRFETPRPPVTGQLYTIRPVWPDGYTVPPGAYCRWTLRWGDEKSVLGLPNQHFGQIWIERKASEGGCNEWTFTLPYTAGLMYQWTFSVTHADGRLIHYTPGNNEKATAFRATVGTMERGIPQSTLPMAYLLPDKYVVGKGERVTYTLYSAGGWVHRDAWFWAYPVPPPETSSLSASPEGGTELGPSQWGGTSFTFVPDVDGDWHVGWTWENGRDYMRAEFDPPVDRRAPVVSGPRPGVGLGQLVDGQVPVQLSWTARDAISKSGTAGSGLRRVELQVSRNGGRWRAVALPSSIRDHVRVNLSPTGTYRYRVRATDNEGNRSAWVAGPTFAPRVSQESSSSVVKTGAWQSSSSSAASGGALVSASGAGASTTFTFSGRSVGWVAQLAPGDGLAQLLVDNQLIATVDLRAAGVSDRQVVFNRSWSAVGTHKLTVRVLGTYQRPRVTVDAFIVIR
jgi:hypothetical protein